MKAFLYARVGKDANLDAIKDQLQKCNEKATELGVTETEQFIDEGLQTVDDRPSFNKMLSEYRKGDIILADSPDRISRDMTQLLDFHKKYKIYYGSYDFENIPMFDALLETLGEHNRTRLKK